MKRCLLAIAVLLAFSLPSRAVIVTPAVSQVVDQQGAIRPESSYYGYCYYDPASCKWLSNDPKGEDAGVNLSAFCGNDPVNKYDPLGLQENVIEMFQPVGRLGPIGVKPQNKR